MKYGPTLSISEEIHSDHYKRWGKSWYERNKEKAISQANEWQRNNPDKCRLKLTKWRNKNPLKDIWYKAKKRAQEKGLEFNIEVEDFYPLPTHCPVFGIELVYLKNGRQDGCASLDRVDNTKGYTKDNTVLISLRANTLKNNGTIEDFEKIIEYIKKHNAN